MIERSDAPSFYPGPAPKTRAKVEVDDVVSRVEANSTPNAPTVTASVSGVTGTVLTYNSSTAVATVKIGTKNYTLTNYSGFVLKSGATVYCILGKTPGIVGVKRTPSSGINPVPPLDVTGTWPYYNAEHAIYQVGSIYYVTTGFSGAPLVRNARADFILKDTTNRLDLGADSFVGAVRSTDSLSGPPYSWEIDVYKAGATTRLTMTGSSDMGLFWLGTSLVANGRRYNPNTGVMYVLPVNSPVVTRQPGLGTGKYLWLCDGSDTYAIDNAGSPTVYSGRLGLPTLSNIIYFQTDDYVVVSEAGGWYYKPNVNNSDDYVYFAPMSAPFVPPTWAQFSSLMAVTPDSAACWIESNTGIIRKVKPVGPGSGYQTTITPNWAGLTGYTDIRFNSLSVDPNGHFIVGVTGTLSSGRKEAAIFQVDKDTVTISAIWDGDSSPEEAGAYGAVVSDDEPAVLRFREIKVLDSGDIVHQFLEADYNP